MGSIGNAIQPIHIGANKLNIQADNNGAGANQHVFVSMNAFAIPGDSSGGSFTETRVNGTASGAISIQGIGIKLVIDSIFSNKFFLSEGRNDVNILSNKDIVVLAGAASDPLNQGSIVSNNGNILVQSGQNVRLQAAVITANGGTTTILGAGRVLETAFADTVLMEPTGGGPVDPITARIENQAIISIPETVTVNGILSNGLEVDGIGNVLYANAALLTLNVDPRLGKITMTTGVHINAYATPVLPVAMNTEKRAHSPEITSSRSFEVTFGETFRGAIKTSEMKIDSGSCLIRALRSSTTRVGNQIIQLPTGALILVEKEPSISTIRNLSANKLSVRVGNQSFVLEAFQELRINELIHKQDIMTNDIGRRRTKTVQLESAIVDLSECSPLSILGSDPLISSLRKSTRLPHRKILQNIQKLAAAISLVTAAHGPYQK